MTKKELSQLYYLKKEIKEQQRRLKELEILATNCTANVTGLPNGTGVSDKIANYATEIADLKSLIEKNLEKCIEKYKELTTFIENIEDSQLRLILTLRYAYHFTWRQIAFKLNFYDESIPRKKCKNFLRCKFDGFIVKK